jgi:hypothetical protein
VAGIAAVLQKEDAALLGLLGPLQTKRGFVTAKAESLQVLRGNTGQGPVLLVSVCLLNRQSYTLTVVAKGAAETVGLVVPKNLRGMIEKRVLGIPEQGVLHGKMAALAEITNPCIGQEDLLDPNAVSVFGLLELPGPLLQGLLVIVLCGLLDVPLDPLSEHPLIVSLEFLPLLLPLGPKHHEAGEKACDPQHHKGYA